MSEGYEFSLPERSWSTPGTVGRRMLASTLIEIELLGIEREMMNRPVDNQQSPSGHCEIESEPSRIKPK